MVVLVQTWDLHLEGCQSLKDKRSVLKSLKADLRRRLNLAVAEVEHQDLWQRAGLAAAAIGGERRVAEEILREADRMIEAADGVRIIDTTVRTA
ncbi:MAG: DUF503 domain-containing protein [Gemmatimonadota bacterium]|nr:DUF503 domain-containing protein [Gemmatimonadota bacterium]MDH5283508.1 DUF503 domain-containing protein [Gemmatimonadota bacterium]